MNLVLGNDITRPVQNEERHSTMDYRSSLSHRLFHTVKFLPPIVPLLDKDKFLVSDMVVQLKAEFHRFGRAVLARTRITI